MTEKAEPFDLKYLNFTLFLFCLLFNPELRYLTKINTKFSLTLRDILLSSYCFQSTVKSNVIYIKKYEIS